MNWHFYKWRNHRKDWTEEQQQPNKNKKNTTRNPFQVLLSIGIAVEELVGLFLSSDPVIIYTSRKQTFGLYKRASQIPRRHSPMNNGPSSIIYDYASSCLRFFFYILLYFIFYFATDVGGFRYQHRSTAYRGASRRVYRSWKMSISFGLSRSA